MRQWILRICSLMLCLSLLVGMIPGVAQAEGEVLPVETGSETLPTDAPVIETAPTEPAPMEATEPTEAPTAPTEATEPTEAPTTPTEATEPTEVPTTPTEATEPIEEPTTPTEITEPTEEPTLPTEDVFAVYPWELMSDDEFRMFLLSQGHLAYAGDIYAQQSLFARLDLVENGALREQLADILFAWAQSLVAPADYLVAEAEEVKASSTLTLEDINTSDMFFRQEGSQTCTLAANAMLVRRAARLNGYSNWAAITEAAIRPTCWITGTGMTWFYTYAGISVGHGTFSGCTVQTIADFLKQHPEGFVAYNRSVPHAVLITDYTNGVLYCADPANNNGRIPFTQSYIGRGSQENTAAGITDYWYVSSPKLSVSAPRPTVEHDATIGLAAVSNYDNSITLSWKNTGAAGYYIYRAETETGPWEVPIHDAAGADATTWTDTTGERLKPYYYCVRPYDANHVGGTKYSNVVMAIPDVGGVHIADGTCGNALNWAIYEDGKMVIDGSGAILDYEVEQDVPWYAHRASIREVVVSQGVIAVGQYAFSGCENLEKVTLPTGLTAIYDWAFSDCGSLTEITLPSSLVTIGYAAFRGCSSLQSLVVPDNVSSIGQWAFSKCTALTSVRLPERLTTISMAMFYEDTALKTVNLPGSLTAIEAHAFRDCRSLENLHFSSSLATIGDYAFAMCQTLSSIAIDRGGNLTTLGEGVFYNCSGLRQVSLTGAQIGQLCFAYCYNLRYVFINHFNKQTSIANYAFQDCGSLAYVLIVGGDFVRTEAAFTGTRAVILVSNASVGGDLEQAEGNSTLRTFRAAGRCSGSVFWYLDANATLYICGDGATGDYSSTGAPWRYLKDIIQTLRVESGITGIGSNAFSDLSNVKNIYFSASAPSISSNSFLSVAANVHYHDTDNTWGGVANQNYGGRLTWISGHTLSWKLETTPTAEKTGSLVGTCSSCSGRETVELPRLDLVNYTFADGCYIWNVTDYGTYSFAVAPIRITSQPVSAAAVPGDAVAFQVAAEGSSPSYQWQYLAMGETVWQDCDDSFSGWNTPKLQLTASARNNGFRYRCRITDAEGRTAETDPATLTVTGVFEILTQPASQTVAKNTLASFRVQVSGSGMTYQWQWKRNAEAAYWMNCTASTAGHRSPELNPEATTSRNGYLYRCIITDDRGSVLISQAAALTVLESPLRIIGQPVGLTAESGSSVSFKVTAEGTGLRYQWQVRAPTRADWSDCAILTEGETTAELKMKAGLRYNGYQYRCVVSDQSGAVEISRTAILKVVDALFITSQPADVTASAVEACSFTVAAKGTELSYRWQMKPSYSPFWLNCASTVEGYNTDTLQLAEGRDGWQYRCVVTDANGNKRTSEAALLTIE